MAVHFELLKEELFTLRGIASVPGAVGFFAQEAMRFYSIAGSLREAFALNNGTAEERYITHSLARSLLEGFFWLIYIFDDSAKRSARYDEKLNAFKREYGKLWNEQFLPGKNQLEPADPSWAAMPKPLDVNSMLAQAKNNYGDRLSYLYFVYRVASFDTHGNSLNTLFQATFGKDCNFSVLDLTSGFDLIANHYLVILQGLRDAREI